MTTSNPLLLTSPEHPDYNWCIHGYKVTAIHFFDPAKQAVEFTHDQGKIEMLTGRYLVAFEGVNAISLLGRKQLDANKHFRIVTSPDRKDCELYLALPLIAERWEVEIKTPKVGWGDPNSSFPVLKLRGVSFLDTTGRQEGQLHLQGLSTPSAAKI